MGKKMSINRVRLYSFLIYPAAALLLVLGCATEPKTVVKTGESIAPAIQQPDTPPPAQQTKEVDSKSITRVSTTASQVASVDKVEVKDIAPSEPRIFFEPSKSASNQVLGIDFTMAENGKSRLIVTTAKKTSYDLDRKDERTLILKIHDSTIANPLLMRQIDTTQFQSALDGIKQVYLSQKKEVDLILSLREIVPFNIKPTDNGISMDFGQTSVKAIEKKLVPLNLAETETRTLSVSSPTSAPASATPVTATAKASTKKYSGERVSLVFTDADVTHILTIINSVSGENVIWDPAIAGKKVSMILNDVPWDEALDLVLDNNELAKRYRGDNIIWVTTKEKMKQVLAEEEAEKVRIRQVADEEAKRQSEREKAAMEDEPIVTQYLPVDFAKADDIIKHIFISETSKKRGAVVTVDTRTNTIILTDIAERIEVAKKTINQFDTPVKQIMIEARIVEASNTFSRNLGIKWNSNTSAWRTDALNEDITVPPFANDFNYDGEKVYGGSFSTNTPDGWISNIGLGFATAVFDGRLTLDASLAIAESEGTAKTLSAPKVIAREGTKAIISSGDSIIIPATENVASTTLDATLSLTVTPTAVSYNNYITMDVAVTDDSAPSTSRLIKKSISTNLMVKSGETIVIGGILKENDSNDVTGVPILKDIPGLGWLFKAKSKIKSKDEILIFLTPTVLASPSQD
jgi:type IV pilus assembly protein PilQ